MNNIFSVLQETKNKDQTNFLDRRKWLYSEEVKTNLHAEVAKPGRSNLVLGTTSSFLFTLI